MRVVALSLSVFLLAWFLCPVSTALSDPPPSLIKVGVLGLDNYQAVAFTQLFHDPKAAGDLAGIRVVAAFPAGSPDIEESVRELPKWTKDIQNYQIGRAHV